MVNYLVIRHCFGMDAEEIDITLYNKKPAIFKIAGFFQTGELLLHPNKLITIRRTKSMFLNARNIRTLQHCCLMLIKW